MSNSSRTMLPREARPSDIGFSWKNASASVLLAKLREYDTPPPRAENVSDSNEGSELAGLNTDKINWLCAR